MDVLADGRARPDGRAEPSLPKLRGGKIKYAIDRYVNETNRLYGVLNKRLADREFIAGDYSIADMASYPWVVALQEPGQNIDDFPHLKRWLETIQARPATVRAYAKAKRGQSEFRPAASTAPRRSARSCSARPRRWCGRARRRRSAHGRYAGLARLSHLRGGSGCGLTVQSRIAIPKTHQAISRIAARIAA